MSSLLRRSERLVLFGLFLVVGAHTASAQATADNSLSGAPSIAFVNVNLIRMDRERIEPGQTVLVRGDRIAAIGAADEVVIPEGSTVIEGAGRYLVPGLTDAHVHLPGFLGLTRPDFGDAPLYLAHGVTTVISLSGTPIQIEWRRRIEAGELLGPTIYTAGPFVNEPRVNTPEEVQREVITQSRQGYDLIKFHELPGTTTGLSLAAYRKMNETAREVGIPLVGHAPVNLGLDVVLQERQALAHMGTLGNIYFLPLQSNFRFITVSAIAMLLLIVVVFTWGGAVIVRRLRHAATPRRSPTLSRVRIVTLWVLLASVAGFAVAALSYPGGPLFDSITLRVLFTMIALSIAVLSLLLSALAAKLWRDTNASMSARTQASLVSIASFALAFCLAVFWVPISWRSTDRGIEWLAGRLKDAGISVQTTLIVYETFSTSGRTRLLQDPAIDYLRPETRDRWRRQPPAGIPTYQYDQFMKRVAAVLQRVEVPLVAGTDTMGAPLFVPGSSLHRELELLTESGLTPYQAIRAATVAPAVFLGKAGEFGTVDVGKRADLLLVEENPLQSIDHLTRFIGVMVRGKWLPREQRDRMLASLVGKE